MRTPGCKPALYHILNFYVSFSLLRFVLVFAGERRLQVCVLHTLRIIELFHAHSFSVAFCLWLIVYVVCPNIHLYFRLHVSKRIVSFHESTHPERDRERERESEQ